MDFKPTFRTAEQYLINELKKYQLIARFNPDRYENCHAVSSALEMLRGGVVSPGEKDIALNLLYDTATHFYILSKIARDKSWKDEYRTRADTALWIAETIKHQGDEEKC